MTTKALALLLAIATTPAFADQPPLTNCSIPTLVPVVGRSGTTPDSTTGSIEVIVRELASNPIAGSDVRLEFSVTTEVRLAATPLDPALSSDCGGRVLSKRTDAAGRVRFVVLGAGRGSAGLPGPVTVVVRADGVVLGSVPVVTYDLDGENGTGANDLSVWLSDVGSLQYYGRGDYDGSGDLGGNDLSLWLGVSGSLRSSESAAPWCP